MIQATQHVTIATSSGAVWLALVAHFGTGLVGIVTGFIALAVAKGGSWHRRLGMAFVYAMISTAVFIVGLSAYEGKPIGGGLFVAYLVFTAFSTMRPKLLARRGLSAGLMLLTLALGLSAIGAGVQAVNAHQRMVRDAPVGMVFFLGGIMVLAGIGDARMLHAGSIQGTKRLARHLWRMCFALFIASGSFFLGQMKFLPQQLRILPLVAALAVSPLLILLYWMWRVRWRNSMRGMTIGNPARRSVA